MFDKTSQFFFFLSLDRLSKVHLYDGGNFFFLHIGYISTFILLFRSVVLFDFSCKSRLSGYLYLLF